MAENGDGSPLPSPLDVLISDVHSRLEFHKYAYIDCVGIKNVLDCVIEEKGKLQEQQNAIVQLVAEKESLAKKNEELVAEKESLAKKNEELVAEIESLKEKLQANESSNLLQGSGFQQSQSGRAQTGSMQKRKRQSGDKDADEHEIMEYLPGMENPDQGMNNPDQGLSTEHEVAREEISDIHSKLIKYVVHEDSVSSDEDLESDEEDSYIVAQRVNLKNHEKDRVVQLLPERATYVGVPFVTRLSRTNLRKHHMKLPKTITEEAGLSTKGNAGIRLGAAGDITTSTYNTDIDDRIFFGKHGWMNFLEGKYFKTNQLVLIILRNTNDLSLNVIIEMHII